MTDTNKHNEECCNRCDKKGEPGYITCTDCSCHTADDDGPNAVGNQMPATDVSWEEDFDEIFGTFPEMAPKSGVKVFIRKQIDLAFDKGYAKCGGVESEQKQRMFEAGKGIGRKEAIAEIRGKIIKEINENADDGSDRLDTGYLMALQNMFAYVEALSNK